MSNLARTTQKLLVQSRKTFCNYPNIHVMTSHKPISNHPPKITVTGSLTRSTKCNMSCLCLLLTVLHDNDAIPQFQHFCSFFLSSPLHCHPIKIETLISQTGPNATFPLTIQPGIYAFTLHCGNMRGIRSRFYF
jgi:hypothetical protein